MNRHMFAFVAAKTIRRLKKNNLIDEEEDREWVEDEGEEEEDGGMGDKERERERDEDSVKGRRRRGV